MATVYLARDRKYNRAVALKVLKPRLPLAPTGVGSSARIGLLARMRHHVLPLFDSGVLSLAGGRDSLFCVMPYVEGESLRDRLERDATMSLPDALRIACEVADALAYAHGQHIVHRDIRPESILLSGGAAIRRLDRQVLEVSGGDLDHRAGPGPSRSYEPRAGEGDDGPGRA